MAVKLRMGVFRRLDEARYSTGRISDAADGLAARGASLPNRAYRTLFNGLPTRLTSRYTA